MSDDRIGQLERQVLGGDTYALEALKAQWDRQRTGQDHFYAYTGGEAAHHFRQFLLRGPTWLRRGRGVGRMADLLANGKISAGEAVEEFFFAFMRCADMRLGEDDRDRIARDLAGQIGQVYLQRMGVRKPRPTRPKRPTESSFKEASRAWDRLSKAAADASEGVQAAARGLEAAAELTGYTDVNDLAFGPEDFGGSDYE